MPVSGSGDRISSRDADSFRDKVLDHFAQRCVFSSDLRNVLYPDIFKVFDKDQAHIQTVTLISVIIKIMLQKSYLISMVFTLTAFFTALFLYTNLAGPIPFYINSVSTLKDT